MPSFKNFEKNLEGATRGQSFVWEVYGIFWSNLTPLVFGKLTFTLYCIFLTAAASGCLIPIQINHFFQQRMFLVALNSEK